METAMQVAFKQAAIKLPHTERAWRYLKDKPGSTTDDVDKVLKFKNTASVIHDLWMRDMVTYTEDTRRTPKGTLKVVKCWKAIGQHYVLQPKNDKKLESRKPRGPRKGAPAVEAVAPAPAAAQVPAHPPAAALEAMAPAQAPAAAPAMPFPSLELQPAPGPVLAFPPRFVDNAGDAWADNLLGALTLKQARVLHKKLNDLLK